MNLTTAATILDDLAGQRVTVIYSQPIRLANREVTMTTCHATGDAVLDADDVYVGLSDRGEWIAVQMVRDIVPALTANLATSEDS
jgi:N-dimethylarginine dimethylaminohydrolase